MTNELPEGWATANLFEICQPKQWPTLSTEKLLDSGYPVYGANGQIGYYSEFTHSEPTIAITCRGATCGRLNLTLPNAWINGNAMAIDNLNAALISRDFLFRYFLWRGFKNETTGSAQPQITRENLKSVEVLLPPLAEQRRIVAKVEELTARSRAARAALAEVPTLLEQFRQSVLASAFRGDLTADWRAKNPNAEPASVLLDRIRAERRKQWEEKYPKKKYVEPEPVDDSDLPELPEGWLWVALESLATHQSGLAYRSQDFTGEGVQVVKLGTLYQGRFDLRGRLETGLFSARVSSVPSQHERTEAVSQ